MVFKRNETVVIETGLATTLELCVTRHEALWSAASEGNASHGALASLQAMAYRSEVTSKRQTRKQGYKGWKQTIGEF